MPARRDVSGEATQAGQGADRLGAGHHAPAASPDTEPWGDKTPPTPSCTSTLHWLSQSYMPMELTRKLNHWTITFSLMRAAQSKRPWWWQEVPRSNALGLINMTQPSWWTHQPLGLEAEASVQIHRSHQFWENLGKRSTLDKVVRAQFCSQENSKVFLLLILFGAGCNSAKEQSSSNCLQA